MNTYKPDLFTTFLKDWTTGMERQITQPVLPVCDECSTPFSGPDRGYGKTHLCGSCAQQIAREDESSIVQAWKEADCE